MIESTLASQGLFGAELIVFSIYALSFIVEMAFNSYTKDEIEIIDGMPDDEDTYENSYVKSGGYDELVFAEKKDYENNEKTEAEDDVRKVTEFDDFIIGYGAGEDKEPIPYLTKKEMKKATSSRLVFYNDNSEEKSEPVAEQTAPAESEEIEAEEPVVVEKTQPKAEKSVKVKKLEPKPVSKPAPKKEPEKELSDIDLLLQELDSKK